MAHDRFIYFPTRGDGPEPAVVEGVIRAYFRGLLTSLDNDPLSSPGHARITINFTLHIPAPSEPWHTEAFIEVYCCPDYIDVITRMQPPVIRDLADGLERYLRKTFL